MGERTENTVPRNGEKRRNFMLEYHAQLNHRRGPQTKMDGQNEVRVIARIRDVGALSFAGAAEE